MKAGLSATTKILHLWHLCMFFSTHQGPHAISMGLVSKAWHSDGISEKNVCPKALIVSWLCRCLTMVKINIYCITSTDHTDSGTKLPPKLLPQNNWINWISTNLAWTWSPSGTPPKKNSKSWINIHSMSSLFDMGVCLFLTRCNSFKILRKHQAPTVDRVHPIDPSMPCHLSPCRRAIQSAEAIKHLGKIYGLEMIGVPFDMLLCSQPSLITKNSLKELKI